MHNLKRFNEESLSYKEYFYSELNKEGITDEDQKHSKKVWREFNIKNLGEYHDLYVQSDTTLLADASENFRDKCLEIYEFDPIHVFISTRISMASMFKKDRSKIKFIN